MLSLTVQLEWLRDAVVRRESRVLQTLADERLEEFWRHRSAEVVHADLKHDSAFVTTLHWDTIIAFARNVEMEASEYVNDR